MKLENWLQTGPEQIYGSYHYYSYSISGVSEGLVVPRVKMTWLWLGCLKLIKSCSGAIHFNPAETWGAVLDTAVSLDCDELISCLSSFEPLCWTC